MRSLVALFILGIAAGSANGQERDFDARSNSTVHENIKSTPEPERKLWFERAIDRILVGPDDAKADTER